MKTRTGVHSSIRNEFCVMIAVLGLSLQAFAHASASEIKVPRITKEEVKPILGNPDVIILDVRSARDWKNTQWKIKGAVREDPNEKSGVWMDKYQKEKTLVLYCA